MIRAHKIAIFLRLLRLPRTHSWDSLKGLLESAWINAIVSDRSLFPALTCLYSTTSIVVSYRCVVFRVARQSTPSFVNTELLPVRKTSCILPALPRFHSKHRIDGSRWGLLLYRLPKRFPESSDRPHVLGDPCCCLLSLSSCFVAPDAGLFAGL